MRLLFMGTPEFAVPSLRALAGRGHELAAVVTRPDRPRRSSASPAAPSPVKSEAARLGIPVWQPDSVRDTAFVARVRSVAPETIVVVAFGRILPADLLEVPKAWCINLHASLLPAYRGAAPIARAILAGETRTGLTTMRMDAGLDTGDLLLVKECAIEPLETAGELSVRLAAIGADLLIETLEAHAKGVLLPRPQDASRATYAPALRREDGSIDWEEPAEAVVNRIRGCNPWPLAAAGLRGGRVQILRAAEAITEEEAARSPAPPARPDPPPGQVVAASGGRLIVACGAGSLLSLQQIRFPGRRALTSREALNGRLVGTGDRFTPPPS